MGKKIISLLLVFTMIFAISIPNVYGAENDFSNNLTDNLSAQTLTESLIYNDIANHWAKFGIERWSNYGIIQGSEGLFRPDSPITRGEMAVIIDRVMKYQVKSLNSFNDLDSTWYTDAILGANKAGIILGNNGLVRPTDLITREEAAVMLGRALHISESDIIAEFSDMSSISEWAVGYINALTSLKIINGIGDNLFAPKSNITRGEVVKILDNAIKGLFSNAGIYTEDVDGDVIINTCDVTLKDMEVSGNLIVAEGVGEGEVNIDNVKIKGNITIKGGGENSIYFNNVTVEGALIVNKVGGNLRIVATGSTSVSVATLESGAILVTRNLIGGGIEKVEIPASVSIGQNIVLQGNFNTVVNNASGIKLETSGKINNLVLSEKTTITGNAVITSITTAEGADSVINGTSISGGQTGTKLTDDKKDSSNNNSSSGNSGGDSGNDNTPISVTGVTLNKSSTTLTKGLTETLIATISPANATTKSAIWATSNPSVATVNKGIVTAVSTGSAIISVTTVDGNKSDSCVVTVIDETEPEPGWQPPQAVDSRFAPGYPQVSVNSENKIELKVKLISTGEVFMIINQYNSDTEPSVNSVIHGHTGEDGYGLVQSDEAAYINVKDTSEHTITTNVTVEGNEDVKVYFAIRDSVKTSESPTLIEFTAEVVSELDNRAPYFYNAYINKEKNRIILYFDEILDNSAIINNSEFSLNRGTILSSSIKNYNNGVGTVVLNVAGIEDIIGLTITYTGTSLKDTAVAKNSVYPITNKTVYDATISVSPDEIYVSSNGQYINIDIDKALFFEPGRDNFIIALKYGSTVDPGTLLEEYELNWSYSNNGSSMQISIKLNEEPILTDGYKYFITIDSNGLNNYAGDSDGVINVEGTPSEVVESSITPTAVYDSAYEMLTITFPLNNGLLDNGVYGCFFKLTSGGKEYILRENTWFDGDNLFINSSSFPFDQTTFNWTGATISYSLDVHPEASIHDCLTFKSGMPYEGFSDIPVLLK